jgi:two-component system, cell cycle response regulator CpdR
LTATTTSNAKTLSKSILILDDEYDIVNILKKSLSIAGFSVFGFTDPVLALEHFKSNSDMYEIVLTDVRMPQMNGIEFATHIRRISPIVKILMMSAFDMDDLNIQSSLQIAEFLQKLFSPIALLKIISKYMAIA